MVTPPTILACTWGPTDSYSLCDVSAALPDSRPQLCPLAPRAFLHSVDSACQRFTWQMSSDGLITCDSFTIAHYYFTIAVILFCVMRFCSFSIWTSLHLQFNLLNWLLESFVIYRHAWHKLQLFKSSCYWNSLRKSGFSVQKTTCALVTTTATFSSTQQAQWISLLKEDVTRKRCS